VPDLQLAAAPSINPATLAALETCAWIEAGEPVVLLGDSGTGKTHLLIGLGIAACERGLRVRYVTAAALVNELVEAADERTLSRVVVCPREWRPPSPERIIQPRRPSPKFHDERDIL
jgi:DNA replication protein DnaC